MPARTIFVIFLQLGLTAFGGPTAHLAYFHRAFVLQRRWLSEAEYAQLLALCQALPGPTSSQLGMAIGLTQGGLRGALAAWAGFTLPSALLLVWLAYSLHHHLDSLSPWLHGLELAVIAIILHALWSMQKTLCPDTPRRLLMLAAAGATLLLPGVAGQLSILMLAALIGWLYRPDLSDHARSKEHKARGYPTQRQARVSLLLLALSLATLPWLTDLLNSPILHLFDALFRSGALIFGGGHVVLPFLYQHSIALGIDEQTFLSGYGITQLMPGPLFSFAALLGANLPDSTLPYWLNALLALLAIFLPGSLLLIGLLPYWSTACHRSGWQYSLWGINAAVVGLLLATLITPLWPSAVHTSQDIAIVALAAALLLLTRLPLWIILHGCTLASVLLQQALP